MARDPRDILDLGPSAAPPQRPGPVSQPNSASPPEPADPRPWLGVLFECCHVYARVYRAHGQQRYSGACPRCGARVSAQVGKGGTSQRIFRAQ